MGMKFTVVRIYNKWNHKYRDYF